MIFSSGFADNLKEMRGFVKKISTILFFGLLVFPISAFCQVDTAWVRRYNGLGSGDDEVRAMAIDDSGNVYVTGRSTGGGGSSDFDYATIKYDRNGNAVWVRRYSSSFNGGWDEASSLALGSNGHVYVTGGNGDYATIRYDAAGNQQWVARYSGLGDGSEWSNEVDVDEKGNVYVTGVSRGAGTYTDYATVKYDSNGNELWATRFNGRRNDYDFGNLIAIDKDKSVYVSGVSMIENTRAWVTIKYDSAGNQLWFKEYFNDSICHLTCENGPRALKLDERGNVYVAGTMQDSITDYDYTIIKYDSQGNQLWAMRYDSTSLSFDRAYVMVLDGRGNVYVTGRSYGIATGEDIVTIKYDSMGSQLWIQRYNSPDNGADIGNAIAIDSSGNIYVAGMGGASWDFILLKYDDAGSLLWVNRYDGPDHLAESWPQVSIDGKENVYLAGVSRGQNKGYDFVTIKYSPLPTLRGDLNLDGVMTLADVVLMLNFTFNGTPFPAAPSAGDLNCDGRVSPADVSILLLIFFASLPPPC